MDIKKVLAGGRYRLTLWHGGATDGSDPTFPPREVVGEVMPFEDEDGQPRYEVRDATMTQPDAEGGTMTEEGATIGFLPEHVLKAEVVK